MIVMDDGLQNPSLAKDWRWAVFDGFAGTGNGLVLPSGPLRASLAAQWRVIDAVLVIGPGERGERIAAMAHMRGTFVVRARIVPDEGASAGLRGRRVLAFAGIGRPEKFFRTLGEIGADVVERRAFPDHHPYRASEISGLLTAAERLGLVPVTTEKDVVRLSALATSEPRLASLQTLPVSIVFDDPGALAVAISERLANLSCPVVTSAAAARGA